MSEEKTTAEEQAEKPAEKPVTEEMKVQAKDLLKTIEGMIREGTVRRVMVIRQGRTLLDIPLVAGVAAGLAMAFWAPFIAAIALVGGLVGGFTVRVERDEPKAEM